MQSITYFHDCTFKLEYKFWFSMNHTFNADLNHKSWYGFNLQKCINHVFWINQLQTLANSRGNQNYTVAKENIYNYNEYK